MTSFDSYKKTLSGLCAKADKILISTRGVLSTSLSDIERKQLKFVVDSSETTRGVLTVLITSLLKKAVDPAQDIRYHQKNMKNGYAGRVLDTQVVTPFMKECGFPFMKESGWLTRSLEQNYPYDKNYRGKITPIALKAAFLSCIDNVQVKGKDPKDYLIFIFEVLLLQKSSKEVLISKLKTPDENSIEKIVTLLDMHFSKKYSSGGASRLPVLAFYSIYQCLINEMKRFEGKRLVDIEEHTSPDSRSGMIGDIEVRDQDGEPFESVEIKHGIPITKSMVSDAFQKFKSHKTSRYYILSTAGIKEGERPLIKAEIDRIRKIHGCHVIVNGVVDSLKYYMRLLRDPSIFLAKYVENLKRDRSLKPEHLEYWHKITS